jgi:tRNA (guanine37-N1)-methyltransferase
VSRAPAAGRTGAQNPVLHLDIVTIFPEYFAPLSVSLIGKAVERGDISIAVHDLRSWTNDPHRTVDDTPFGGGPGMVMLAEPWGEALDAILTSASCADQAEPSMPGVYTGASPRLIVPTPAGTLFDQAAAAELATCDHLIFACGRYEGIDARVAEYARTLMPVHELSIGDYVLGGGEPAVLVMAEAICRLLPGVLGNAESAPDDSFGAGVGPMHGLVEGPAYTRPRTWRGMEVPDVLLSGNHAAIARWRRDEALRRTVRTRPDLAARLAGGALSVRDRQVLSEAGFAATADDVAH